jgi:hypothetical protein
MSSAGMNLLTEHAREMVNAPPEWDAWLLEVLGDVQGPNRMIHVRGGVARPVQRGKRKGQPNWAKRDRAMDRDAYFSVEDHEAWLRQWEAKTGKCSKCTGKGQEFAGWNIETGTKMRQCRKCGGTGTAVTVSGEQK